MFKNIVIIDDDQEIIDLLEEYLTNHNFKVVGFNSPIAALKAFEKKHEFEFIILDIMMPEMDGFQVLRKIREFSSIPIIMLTAKGDVADKVVGLELGADDYLSKPFEPAELLARIQSILRRTSAGDVGLVDVVEFEGLKVDKIKQIIEVDNQKINLSTAELEALLLFVNNANKPLSRDFLVENLRGIQWQTCDRSVDVLVSRLRHKLGESPTKTRFIKTVHGIGYRFIGVQK